MRFVAGLFLSFIFGILLFGFNIYVSHKKEEWRDMGKELSIIEQWMLILSDLLKAYWYIWIPVLILFGLFMASLFSSSQSEISENEENENEEKNLR